MIVVYLLMLVAWIPACVYFREGLLRIQLYIGGLMLIGLFESVFYHLYYVMYNKTGHVSFVLLFLAVLFNALKQTFSRLMVLLVALGYSVVRYILLYCVACVFPMYTLSLCSLSSSV
jgi:GOST, seven transmembrane domain